jgi:hypothetical protein
MRQNASEGAEVKTVFALRVRFDDTCQWSDPTYYRTRKQRDNEATHCRHCGMRTHSYDDMKTKEELEKLEVAEPN